MAAENNTAAEFLLPAQLLGADWADKDDSDAVVISNAGLAAQHAYSLTDSPGQKIQHTIFTAHLKKATTSQFKMDAARQRVFGLFAEGTYKTIGSLRKRTASIVFDRRQPTMDALEKVWYIADYGSAKRATPALDIEIAVSKMNTDCLFLDRSLRSSDAALFDALNAPIKWKTLVVEDIDAEPDLPSFHESPQKASAFLRTLSSIAIDPDHEYVDFSEE